MFRLMLGSFATPVASRLRPVANSSRPESGSRSMMQARSAPVISTRLSSTERIVVGTSRLAVIRWPIAWSAASRLVLTSVSETAGVIARGCVPRRDRSPGCRP